MTKLFMPHTQDYSSSREVLGNVVCRLIAKNTFGVNLKRHLENRFTFLLGGRGWSFLLGLGGWPGFLLPSCSWVAIASPVLGVGLIFLLGVGIGVVNIPSRVRQPTGTTQQNRGRNAASPTGGEGGGLAAPRVDFFIFHVFDFVSNGVRWSESWWLATSAGHGAGTASSRHGTVTSN